VKELLKMYPLANSPKESRIHPLPSFDTDSCAIYIKREDELGSLATGIKLRKYMSLIPYLQSSQREVAIIGGPGSNNVLALSLLLNEHKIPYTLFLQGVKNTKVQGNFFFTLLGTPSNKIIWVEKDLEFDQIKDLYEEKLQKRFSWVPMGASCKQSLPGALTLAEDILRNQKEHSLSFSHIFIDAGTGFAAAALLLGLGYLKWQGVAHIVQVAGGDLEFFVMLEECKKYFGELFGLPASPIEFHMHRPKKAKSFGSISKEHLKFITSMARQEGILLDPMYNAKLFLEAKESILEENLSGNILIIQSGGTLSLSGFMEHFKEL
jgi:1-aminocyclopropane-1-carboxylate deaminase/D-cysteine desulfhydrase-like pyridoxal-dependent ACC family enzyme